MKKAFNLKKALVLVLVLVMCISVFAACDNTKEEDMSSLNNAKTYLRKWADEHVSTSTPSNVELIARTPGLNSAFYDINWSITVTTTEGLAETDKVELQVIENVPTIVVPEKASVDINYTLKAVISDGTNNVSLEWNLTVPKWRELTWAEYEAATADTAIVIKGYVCGIIAKSKGAGSNCIYVQDEVGGYYVYALDKDPVTELNLAEGMLVRVTGKKDVYSGTLEVKDASVEILDQTITTQTPVDYTEIYTKAESLKDSALASKQGLLVTVKGVTLTSQDSDSGYYKFKLGDLESYIRISSSVCPLTKDEQATMIANHKSGYTADVTGVICVYSGAFYLTPVSANAISNLQLPELTGADAVAAEKGLLSITTSYDKETVVSLPAQGTNYTKVAIAWAFKDGEAPKNATIDAENGKLNIVPGEEAETFTIVATLTEGEASDTVEFVITIDAVSSQEYLPSMATSAQAGTYKIVMDLTATNQGYRYFDGTLSSIGALNTTDKASKAADVVIAAVEGGYSIKVGDKYLVAYANVSGDKTYNNLKLDDECSNIWTWNDTVKLFTTKVGETELYLGTYLNGTTAKSTAMSLNKLSYISGESASKIDVSQFVGRLATLVDAEYKNNFATSGQAGTYKIVMDLTATNQGYRYFDGTLSSIGALNTTDNYSKAADVVIAAVEGGYSIKVGDKYLVAYANVSGDKTYNNLKLDDECSNIWTWNDTVKLFTTKVGETELYLGTYLNGTTAKSTAMSLNKLSYISGESASKIDVSQFVGRMSTLSLAEVRDYAVESAAAGTYKITMDLTATNQGYRYFDGTLSSIGALNTTDNYSKAADVVIAAVEGGYSIKVGDKYLVAYANVSGDKTYNNLKLDDECSNIWTWNDTVKLFTTKVGETELYLGTYLNGTTAKSTAMSLNKLSYISGESASKIDVSQFVGRMTVRDFVRDSADEPAEETDADKIAKIEVPSYVSENFKLDESATWTIKSGTGIALDGVNATVTRGAEDQTVVLTAQIGEETKDFTVIVPQNGKVVANISDLGVANGWSDTTTKQEFTLDSVVTCKVNGGKNSGKFYTNQIRIYATDSPAGSLTISVADGYQLVSVKISCATGTYAYLTVGDDAATDISNTLTTVSGSSVVLNAVKNGTDGKQVRVTAIEVVYAVAE